MDIHVAAGIIRDAGGRVLLARRPPDTHQPDLWEFPGGKVDPGEDRDTALRRELDEELGVRVGAVLPLIRVRHDYGDRRVCLHVLDVLHYEGTPHGREGQPLDWFDPESLADVPMPAADRPVVTALRLPDIYLITGETPHDPEAFASRAEARLQAGCRLLQLRLKTWPRDRVREMAAVVAGLAHRHGARVLINDDVETAIAVGADGVHLTAQGLGAVDRRPSVPWVGASCHDAREITQARRLGADFVTLSPVFETAGHPGVPALGLDAFARLTAGAQLPVFALGGMGPERVGDVRRRGGRGVAGISGFWENPAPGV